MNIGDITNGSVSTSKNLKQRSVDQINNPDGRIVTHKDLPEEKQELQDSVDISEEARRVLAENQKRLQELEQAREALADIPRLSAERKQEIQERIDAAYYSKPEILDKIASRITRDLGDFKR
ncbi:MAG: hypothetical protein AB8G77_27940 [Rhodothermales bacterium]